MKAELSQEDQNDLVDALCETAMNRFSSGQYTLANALNIMEIYAQGFLLEHGYESDQALTPNQLLRVCTTALIGAQARIETRKPR